MTALDETGTAAPPCTEHHRYELPDLLALGFRCAPVEFNGYHQYLLPHPSTGRKTAYSRASTVAKALDSGEGLVNWKARMIVYGLAINPALLDGVSLATSANDIDAIIESASVAAGSADGREFGSAVHAWAAVVDAGLVLPSQVPEIYRGHITAYLEVCARHCLVPLPGYIERTVLNHSRGVAGTFDRIYQAVDGSLIMGDVKTTKSTSLQYSFLSFSAQLATYRDAEYLLDFDGTTWLPMPELNEDFGLIMHLPSDRAEMSAAIPFDLDPGRTGIITASEVRSARSAAKHEIANNHDLPIPEADMVRRHQAALALRLSSSKAEVAACWEAYQDVWTDGLTKLGTAVIEQLTIRMDAS